MKPYLDETFLQLGRGFQFSVAPPAKLADPAHLASDDPWTVLGCALLRAQQGTLDAVSALPGLMARNDEALVWNGCIELIGFAGRQSFVFDTAKRFLSHPEDDGVQWYVSTMMLNACSLRAVEPLLTLHGAATDDHARLHVEHCLSTLLEDGWGEVRDGPEERKVADPDYPEPFTQYQTVLDRIGYANKVRAVAAEVARRLAHPDQPVTAGKPFDLHALTLALYEHIRSGAAHSKWMEWARMCFEAFTGIDCSGFYIDGSGSYANGLQRPAAMAVLENFLGSGDAARFEIGSRYFFGHRVPD